MNIFKSQKSEDQLNIGLLKIHSRAFASISPAASVNYGYRFASDLTDALGISRPSLYAAFGDKGNLFRMALQKYHDAYTQKAIVQLESSDEIEKAIRNFLQESVQVFTDKKLPTGCLLELHLGRLGLDEESSNAIKRFSDILANTLQKRYERALADGQMPRFSTPIHLTELTLYVLGGLSQSARNGAPRQQLERTIKSFTNLLRNRQQLLEELR